MSSLSLSVLTVLTEEVLPRETFKNEHGVYLHTWVFPVYDDGKGSYFRVYLACKNGMWGSVSTASGKTWGYGGPLWDGDFVHPTIEDALRGAWEEFERVEPCFHTKPKFYDKAKKAFDTLMALPTVEKIAQLKIRD
jgi:hypothetical protein